MAGAKLYERYVIYLMCITKDNDGNDIETGEPPLTFDEWLNK